MAKNRSAVALGKLRAKTMTVEERSKGGKIGGKARARALTKEQRQEIARKAATARWGKKPSVQRLPGTTAENRSLGLKSADFKPGNRLAASSSGIDGQNQHIP